MVRRHYGDVLHGDVSRPRANPYIVTVGNPPVRRRLGAMRFGGSVAPVEIVGSISANVHQIKYRHVQDGAAYRHDFEDDDVTAFAVMWKGQRAVLIIGGHGQPVWEDV